MSSLVAGSLHSVPARTMLGLSSMPSNRMRWSCSALMQAACTFSVAAAARSIVWSPSMRTSGSTMGTRPLAWQMAA